MLRQDVTSEVVMLTLSLHLRAVHAPADAAGGQLPARLRHFLQLRTQWLNISGEHVASVARVGQAVMHLELSR